MDCFKQINLIRQSYVARNWYLSKNLRVIWKHTPVLAGIIFDKALARPTSSLNFNRNLSAWIRALAAAHTLLSTYSFQWKSAILVLWAFIRNTQAKSFLWTNNYKKLLTFLVWEKIANFFPQNIIVFGIVKMSYSNGSIVFLANLGKTIRERKINCLFLSQEISTFSLKKKHFCKECSVKTHGTLRKCIIQTGQIPIKTARVSIFGA